MPKEVGLMSYQEFYGKIEFPLREAVALTYGMEALIQVELWIPTFRMENINLVANKLSMILELDLLDQKRDQITVRTTH